MTEKFEVGEIAIYIDGPRHLQECEVIAALGPKEWESWKDRSCCSGLAYFVRFSDGKEMAAMPKNLRKRKPPERPHEEVGEWELCPWQPKKEYSDLELKMLRISRATLS